MWKILPTYLVKDFHNDYCGLILWLQVTKPTTDQASWGLFFLPMGIWFFFNHLLEECSSQRKHIGMYILPRTHSSHGHWKCGVAVRKCVKVSFPGCLLPGGITAASGIFVSSLRENLLAHGGLVHSCPTSRCCQQTKMASHQFSLRK